MACTAGPVPGLERANSVPGLEISQKALLAGCVGFLSGGEVT